MSLEELDGMFPYERTVYIKMFEKFVREEKEAQDKANQTFMGQ